MQDYFNSGVTKEYQFRKEQLLKLKHLFEQHEDKIAEAVGKDLGKSPLEAKAAEIWVSLGELNHALKKLKKWMKPKRVKTPLFLFPASTKIESVPKGVVLIIAPWNYPFLLSIEPMVMAIAAGNTVVLKPSELTTHTSKLVSEIIAKIFPVDYVTTIQGGVSVATELLEQRWDYIFFTPSALLSRSWREDKSARFC